MNSFRLDPPLTLNQAFHEAQMRLSQMPNDILNKLNKSSSELTHFIQTLPTIQAMENKRQHLLVRNRQLATNNLQREPELLHARHQLSYSFVELAPLRDKYLKSLKEKQEDIPSPDLILVQLQSIAHSSDRLNDEMIETFLHTYHTDADLEIFIKNFLHDRQKTIKHRIIAEKFFDLYQIEKRKN